MIISQSEPSAAVHSDLGRIYVRSTWNTEIFGN